jgi:hypothetical protein
MVSSRVVASDGSNEGWADLQGEGLRPIKLTITPDTYDFGLFPSGPTRPLGTFQIRNDGDATADHVTFAVIGDFEMTMNGCTSDLPAQKSCTVEMTFNPRGSGPMTGALNAIAGGSTAIAMLSGTGASPDPLQILPFTVSFGPVLVGTSSQPSSLMITNNDETSAVSGLTVMVQGMGAAAFVLNHGCGSTLAPRASCMATVTFRPQAAGPHFASVVVRSQGPAAATQMTGVGITP